MSEVLIPPWIIPEEEPQEPLDEGSSVFNAAFAPGLTQRQSYGGMRLKLSRRHTVRLEEKAQLLSALRSTRGRYNVVRSKVHFALRGSFPASELLTNNTFANGTSGWSASTGPYSIAVADRALRSTRINGSGTPQYIVERSTADSVTQYAPHIARVFVQQVRGAYASGFSVYEFGVVGYSASTGVGFKSQVIVPKSSTWRLGFVDNETSGLMTGDYVSFQYFSLSRCALVDNGTNLSLRSDAFDTSPWAATRATANVAMVAPDGTSTALRIIEDATATQTHFIAQTVSISSSSADYSFACALRAGTRTWAALQLVELTGSSTVTAYFNLSTGATGTAVISGANFNNQRSYISPLGDGWYYCVVVANKSNAATQLSERIYIAEADNDVTFTGDGASYITAWRATPAQSSLPARLVQTTSAASTGTSQTGSALYIKGLPASTSGLLLPEDVFEINGELKTCTAALNSDAAGLGYLQFEPALVRSPADNDPVIILDPMGKFLMSNLKIDNEFGTQAKVSYDLEHIYE